MKKAKCNEGDGNEIVTYKYNSEESPKKGKMAEAESSSIPMVMICTAFSELRLKSVSGSG